jgi:outer membrane protein OmpA-like peptidoglycan-associated protein
MRHDLMYLIKKNGISLDRLSWQGNGDTHPISDNDSEKGRALNRGVEFLIENNNQT